MNFKIIFLLLFLSLNVQAHGIRFTTAKIELRPANLVEVSVQFDFIALLNHQSNDYSLPVIAGLTDQQFERLYTEVIKLFNNQLKVSLADKEISIHKRYPTQEQVFSLIKREFIFSKFKNNKTPYTFSDRRFYQVFNFDFKINSVKDIKLLQVSFPEQLGTVYSTFTQKMNKEIKQGDMWSL